MKYVIVLAMVIFYNPMVEAMSIFGVGKTCVFSEVKLRLQLHGKPVSKAKVTRKWDWNAQHSDEGVTDQQGMVSFPAVFESSVSRLLPMELEIGQQLSVEIDGEEKIFWTNSKREPEENAEYGGLPFVAECELSQDEELIEDYGSLMVTMCKLIKEK